MANEQNLTHKLTVSEQREGGKKSGEVRRKKKAMREIMEEYGQQPNKSHPEIDNDTALVIHQYELAMESGNGSTQAATFIRDTKGEKPDGLISELSVESITISFSDKKRG